MPETFRWPGLCEDDLHIHLSEVVLTVVGRWIQEVQERSSEDPQVCNRIHIFFNMFCIEASDKGVRIKPVELERAPTPQLSQFPPVSLLCQSHVIE